MASQHFSMPGVTPFGGNPAPRTIKFPAFARKFGSQLAPLRYAQTNLTKFTALFRKINTLSAYIVSKLSRQVAKKVALSISQCGLAGLTCGVAVGRKARFPPGLERGARATVVGRGEEAVPDPYGPKSLTSEKQGLLCI